MSLEAAITQEGGSPPGGIPIRVRCALISVSDKTGIVDFARGLRELGVQILSTGGTAAAIRDAGLEVTEVAEFTGSPEILDGRVKTLHPRAPRRPARAPRQLGPHGDPGGRGNRADRPRGVNLYPFQRTIEKPGVTEREAVENIDIGGPTMIRAAAKNHAGVAVVVKPEAYDAVLEELRESGGEISTRDAPARGERGVRAHGRLRRGDLALVRRTVRGLPRALRDVPRQVHGAPYGENPHQKAALYVESAAGKHHVLAGVSKHHGKALSFNNILDLDGAWRLLDEFSEPACVIVKHNNPCGTAIAETVNEAYERAFACDPLSAFGGVLLFNRPIDRALAERLNQQFVEVLLAPDFDEGAMEVLTQKESIRILETDDLDYTPRERDVKRVRGGLLVQEPDRIDETREAMTVPTEAQPTEEQWADALFAWKVCRHVRSNAIVFAKDLATIGIGAGQMSRVDSVRIAIDKAREALASDARQLLDGSVVASDAFFPFPDGPESRDARGGDGADPARRIEARSRGDRRMRCGRRRDGVHRPPPLPPLMESGPGAATLHVLRVFCDPGGSGGNPLGVFLDGAEVPEAERQAVARDLGYAETVFVEDPGRGVLRIFTPEVELPLAGHPLVGTAWLLREQGHEVTALRPPAGECAVGFDGELVSISANPEWGPPFEFVQLGSPAAVDALDGGPDGYGEVGVWAWINEPAGLVRARVFVPEAGVDEDEATGSAALRLCALVGREIEIRQGRGSVLHARPVSEGEAQVAGRVVLDEVRPYPAAAEGAA